MKIGKRISRLLAIFGFMAIATANVSGAILDTDTFDSDMDGWSGTSQVNWDSGTKRLFLDRDDTATKTFTFPAYANQTIRFTLDAIEIGTWENDDYFEVRVNGTRIMQETIDGTTLKTFTATLNSSGSVTIAITPNTDSNAEDLYIDNLSVHHITQTTTNGRNFAIRNPVDTRNIFGNVKTIGNTVLCYKVNGVCSDTNYANNEVSLSFIDTDSVNRPYNNSSRAQIAGIPNSAKIVWAGFYTQGYLKTGQNNTIARLTSSPTFLTTPQGITLSLGIDVLDIYPYDTNEYTYSTFTEVTQLKGLNGSDVNGWFTGANIKALEGDDSGALGYFGAWSLVVVYTDSSESLKNVSVFDGYKQIGGSNDSITINGFYTPTSGDVKSTLSVFVGEGDKNIAGDDITLEGESLSSGGSTNAFNSTVNGFTSDPNPVNYQGIDIHNYNVGIDGDTSHKQIIGNGLSEATIGLTTTGDYYYPSMVSFTTELYQPEVCYYEEVYKGGTKLQNGAQVNKGDVLNVKVYVTNKADETAEKVKVYRTFDESLPYVATSTRLDNTNPTYGGLYNMVSQTDAVDADTFDYNATNKKFQIRLGTGAGPVSGGNLLKNQGAAFDYNITMNTEQNTSISYEVAYTNTAINFDYVGQIGKCVDFNNTFWGYYVVPTIGNMDVIEASSYAAAGSYAGANKHLFTKIVKKPFDLEVVYLDDAGAEKIYNGTLGSGPNPKTVNMAVMLYTTDTGTCTEERQMIWRGQIAHTASHVTANIDDVDVDGADEEEGFTITKAAKDQRIKVNFIDYGTLINAATDLTCSTSSLDSSLCLVPACLNSNTQILKAFPLANYPHVATCLYGDGSGNAAPCDSNAYTGSCGGKIQTIGPLKYNNDIGCAMCLADALGMNGCSTDNFAARPDAFTNNLAAMPFKYTAKQFSSITFRANDFIDNATVDYNETEYSSFRVDANISDATKTCAEPSTNFSPDINFTNGTVTDNYALPNIGDFNVTMYEIVGSEYAAVDAGANDTTSLVDRLITPYTVQVTVIPAGFGIDGNITNGSNGFTYLSNFETYPTAPSRDISALLDLNVSALAADGNLTSNYTGNCYAKDGNFTATLNTALAISPAGSLTKLIWYDRNHDLNGSVAIDGDTDYEMAFMASQFDGTPEGTAQVQYLINFDRGQRQFVDPFVFDLNTLSADDNDSVTGNRAIATQINYLYGRIIPRDVRVFGTNVPFQASAWYEVYNSASIGGIPLAPSKNEALWFVNSAHVDTQDGDGNVTVILPLLGSSLPNAGSTYANGVETYTFNGFGNIGGYKAHIQTGPWLWYGINASGYVDPGLDCLTHPCFNITVVPAVGATGSSKTETEATKASKKSDQENGTWKSTSDYAPAVR